MKRITRSLSADESYRPNHSRLGTGAQSLRSSGIPLRRVDWFGPVIMSMFSSHLYTGGAQPSQKAVLHIAPQPMQISFLFGA